MKDRFSNHASQYAAFRPTYPNELFAFLLANVEETKAAWDVGCGNGQVATSLVSHFEEVFATDISAKQIEKAIQRPNIFYSVCAANKSSFPDNSFDLITVGQALHWFDIPAFFKEVERVSKPEGLIAVWGYGLLTTNSPIDLLIQHFYTVIIGPYWDEERKLVDQQYKKIQFPFAEIQSPSFQFSFQWTIEELHGYLSTWSSVQKFVQRHSINPVDDLIERIRPLWRQRRRAISFPLFVRVGRVKKSV